MAPETINSASANEQLASLSLKGGIHGQDRARRPGRRDSDAKGRRPSPSRRHRHNKDYDEYSSDGSLSSGSDDDTRRGRDSSRRHRKHHRRRREPSYRSSRPSDEDSDWSNSSSSSQSPHRHHGRGHRSRHRRSTRRSRHEERRRRNRRRHYDSSSSYSSDESSGYDDGYGSSSSLSDEERSPRRRDHRRSHRSHRRRDRHRSRERGDKGRRQGRKAAVKGDDVVSRRKKARHMLATAIQRVARGWIARRKLHKAMMVIRDCKDRAVFAAYNDILNSVMQREFLPKILIEVITGDRTLFDPPPVQKQIELFLATQEMDSIVEILATEIAKETVQDMVHSYLSYNKEQRLVDPAQPLVEDIVDNVVAEITKQECITILRNQAQDTMLNLRAQRAAHDFEIEILASMIHEVAVSVVSEHSMHGEG